MNRIAVIVKRPVQASRLEALRAAAESLRAAGHDVRVRGTRGPGDARRLAVSAARAGFDVAVAAGGDGTVNEVVNGLVAAERSTALAVVPLGTANDFATGLGIPSAVGDALWLAVRGERACMDLARVNRRCFINVSTGGFGAETKAAAASVKQRFGRLAYVVEGARRLLHYELRAAVFSADGRVVHEGRFAFFAVANARQTGGGTRIAPRAELRDGQLDAVVVGAVSRLDFLSLLPDLRAGTHLESPDVHYVRARSFEVRADGAVPVNADGESVRGSTFRYEVLPRTQMVLVPMDY